MIGPANHHHIGQDGSNRGRKKGKNRIYRYTFPLLINFVVDRKVDMGSRYTLVNYSHNFENGRMTKNKITRRNASPTRELETREIDSWSQYENAEERAPDEETVVDFKPKAERLVSEFVPKTNVRQQTIYEFRHGDRPSVPSHVELPMSEVESTIDRLAERVKKAGVVDGAVIPAEKYEASDRGSRMGHRHTNPKHDIVPSVASSEYVMEQVKFSKHGMLQVYRRVDSSIQKLAQTNKAGSGFRSGFGIFAGKKKTER